MSYPPSNTKLDRAENELRRQIDLADKNRMAAYGDTPSNAVRQATARELLNSYIEELRRDLAGLDALYRALPLELNHEADAALFKLLVRGRG